MKKFLIYLSLGFIPLIVGCGGSELQGEPVALPIPFSGTLTADSNILIAEGNPLNGPSALNASLKSQTSDSPVSWELFDGNLLDSCGSVTISSMSAPINVRPLAGGGEEREYTIDVTLLGSDVAFEIRATLQCFENPTPYDPTQDTLDLASTIPGATSDVRKLVCSGPIDCVCPGGVDCDKSGCVEDQDLNLNLVTDVILHADGTTTFNTQRESNLVFDGPTGEGASFCAGGAGEPAGEVFMTMIMQGFASYSNPTSIPDGPPVKKQFAFSLYFPGNDEAVGTYIQHVHNESAVFDESGGVQQFDTEATGDFLLNDGSFLRVRGVTYEHTHIPELESIFDEVIRNEDLFLNDPNFDDLIFSTNGSLAFHQTAGSLSLGTINFDPAAGEVTGIFRELFDQFGVFTIQTRCLAMANTTTKNPPTLLMPLVLTFTTP